MVFDWVDTGNGAVMRHRLQTLDEALGEKIHAVMEYQGGKAESHMKTSAPWRDRTGNARAGLSHTVMWHDKTHEIRLFHKMRYGIFLETRWAGRFAIILPTIQKFGPDTMRMLQGLFGRLGGGGF